MATSLFPTTNTTSVSTATNGALSGDGSTGNKLAVNVDDDTITVNGSNQLVASGGGGGTPGGSDTQIQFNNAGAFGGSADLTWDGLQLAVTSSIASVPAGDFNGINKQTTLSPSGNIDGSHYITDVNETIVVTGSHDINNVSSYYGGVFHQGSGTITTALSEFDVQNQSNGTISNARPLYSYIQNSGGGHITNAANLYATISNSSGTIDNAYGFWGITPTGAGITTYVAMYTAALGGSATNPYGFWQDEAGVFRIKADNTFDSVYQAIPALYNPQFTKYTPGAANYERIVEQWNGNVGELGIEKGGTGTLRKLRLIGGGLFLTEGAIIPTSDPHVVGQVWANSHVLTVSAG